MTVAIAAQGLTKSFNGIKAVDDLTLTVNTGEVLGFLGPNGAGKSTTMKMLTGFLTPDAGSVHILGHPLAPQPLKVKSHIGYLPEGAPLYGDMTVYNFLAFMARIHGLRDKKKDAAMAKVVSRMQLQQVLQQPISTLSKGFKRRVGLAQALIHNPPVLILDEPTDGLDPNQKYQIRQLIRDMAKEKAIIISTHIMEEVEAVCSHAVIINQGCIVRNSTPQELLAEVQQFRHVVLHLKRDGSEKLLPHLVKAEGVASVEHIQALDQQQVALKIHAEEGKDISRVVNEICQAQKVKPLQMTIETAKLDDLFRQVTLGTMN